MESANNASDLIHRARQAARLSQRGLAEAAGTSQAAISAYESGQRSPTVETLVRIVAATGLELRMSLDAPAETLEKPILRGVSGEEFNEMVRGAAPSTPDDVSITKDGRRLDTKEKLVAFLAEHAQRRADGE